MIQAVLMVFCAAFWLAARLFQPMPRWAIPTMWIVVIAVAVAPYLIGLPTAVMEEAILPACAGFAGGEWAAGTILGRRLKQQKAKAFKRAASRRKRPKKD